MHNTLQHAHIPGYQTLLTLEQQFPALTCLSVAHSTFSVAILPCFSNISTHTCAFAVASCSTSSFACFACTLTAKNPHGKTNT
jgi:hypothetical protein